MTESSAGPKKPKSGGIRRISFSGPVGPDIVNEVRESLWFHAGEVVHVVLTYRPKKEER